MHPADDDALSAEKKLSGEASTAEGPRPASRLEIPGERWDEAGSPEN